MDPLFLELHGITKHFPGVIANDHIDLAVRRGEIHAIVGENGAGKSTLMRILYGLYQPDSGAIQVNGRPDVIDNPRRALELGIGMVHQHFMLIPVFTVAENVILGNEPAAWGQLRMAEAHQQVAELCQQYGFSLDPAALVGHLSVGEQQRVEIIKVLYRGAELLILDEPTAVLVPQEVDELFNNLRRLKEQGKTIIFISHKLDEVLALSDRITVLRRGRVIGTVTAGQASQAQLAEMMVGRPVLLELAHPPATPGAVRLEAHHLSVPGGAAARLAVRDVSLSVRGNEIYGIAGVEGNGQTELVEALVGLRPLSHGALLIDGHDVSQTTARAIRLLGVAHIPEDRHRRGLVLPMAVWENVILGHHYRKEFTNGPLLNRPTIDDFVRRRVHEYDIRVADTEAPVLALSGGNQQKVIVAREFAFTPTVLVAAQPTRGLDIGATEFVMRQLLGAREAGMAVLLVSANLEEILALSDRIGVMYGGEVTAEFVRGEATPTELGLYMTGVKRKERVEAE
jgi:simple sugar transport system ATP-binding protein